MTDVKNKVFIGPCNITHYIQVQMHTCSLKRGSCSLEKCIQNWPTFLQFYVLIVQRIFARSARIVLLRVLVDSWVSGCVPRTQEHSEGSRWKHSWKSSFATVAECWVETIFALSARVSVSLIACSWMTDADFTCWGFAARCGRWVGRQNVLAFQH